MIQESSLTPIKFLLKDTLGENDPNTVAIVSSLYRTMEYKAGYCSLSEVVPSHLSFQNLIWDPSLIEKVLKRKKCFFVAIRPAQMCESPGFQTIPQVSKPFGPKLLIQHIF